MSDDDSPTSPYRAFADLWEAEPMPPGAKWVAVFRDADGVFHVRLTATHDLGALRHQMSEAERDEPEEREAGS